MKSKDEGDFQYEQLPSLPEDHNSPDLLGSGAVEWAAIPDLDVFFRNLYRYYEEKGFQNMMVARVLGLLALLFTIFFSGMFLLGLNWSALFSECIREDTCDVSEVAFNPHPFSRMSLWVVLCCIYLTFISCHFLHTALHAFMDVRNSAEMRHFVQHRLGLSERQLKTVTWPEMAKRIVEAQKTARLCIVRDLTEHDIVSRIMRKDNYLIGMLNRGVLALHVSLPGTRRHFMLTKTLEWNLCFCIFSHMFDSNFRVQSEFVHDVAALRRRFRFMAVLNLLCCPFILLFLIIYFFMKNAERFYHHPSSAGARQWSSLAAWRLREFNELPHYLNHRLNASTKAAEHYIAQFPSHLISHVAKFVAYIAGSFAALFLLAVMLNPTLLERRFYSRNIVWWIATLGIILAVSRAFVLESGVAYEPEEALTEVVMHTHYLPRHWRGRAHTREVQEQFQQLFQFKALLLLEEMASVVVTPFVLYFSLPKCAPEILKFVRSFTTHVEGVGDICSLSAFDFQRHGNVKYGSPLQAPKGARSKQGKMEKSFLSFAATYPSWVPEGHGKQFLAAFKSHPLQSSMFQSGFSWCLPEGPPAATGLSAIAGHASLGPAGRPLPGLTQNPRIGVQLTALSRYMSCHRIPCTGGSMFASAEMGHFPAQPSPSASCMGRSGLTDPEVRIAASQAQLQIMYEEKDREVRLGSLHAMRPSSLEPPSHSITMPDVDAPDSPGSAEPSLLPIRLLGSHSASRPASSSQTPGPRHPGLPPRPREIALVDRPRPKPAQASGLKPQSAARAEFGAVSTDTADPGRPDSESAELDGHSAGDDSPPTIQHAASMADASGMTFDTTRADRSAVDLASHEPLAAKEPLASISPSRSITDEDLEAMPFLAHEDHDLDLDMLEEGASLRSSDSQSAPGRASPAATTFHPLLRPEAGAQAQGACRASALYATSMSPGAVEPPSLQVSQISQNAVEACCNSGHDAAAGAGSFVTGSSVNLRDPGARPVGTVGDTSATHSGMDSNLEGSLSSDGPGFPFFTGAGDLVSVMPDESDVLGFSSGPAMGWQASPHAASGELWSPHLSGNSDPLGPMAFASSDDASTQAGPSLRMYSPRCASPQGGLWHLDGSGSSGDPSLRGGFVGRLGLHLKQALHAQDGRGSNPLASSLPSVSVSASSDEGSLGAFTSQSI